jgi:photosystem II stability/assembly factor-like uncharacterized protein
MKTSIFLTWLAISVSIAAIQPTASCADTGDDRKKDEPEITTEILTGLKFRCLGPAVTSGRIADIAVHPKERNTWYVAVASGGIWKTINAGTTWEPVFENEKSYSIGCVTIDPNNPHVVWAGSGENNSQRSVGYGDGVYRSENDGKSWKNMGLGRSEHIARILIDPRNSAVVYVACQGPLWGPGGDRGLYKSTDAGNTWKCVLSISENTGITDVVMDPRNPDLIYAASYQRRRHVFTMIDGGPECGIHRSTDGGATWEDINSGLPSVDKGRIGLAISPVNPDIIYAIVEAAEKQSGFYRSTNRGAAWEKRSSTTSSNPQYYQELVCDPSNSERVYSLDTWLQVSEDGGATFRALGNSHRHVDDHAMWIDPENTLHCLVGGDGGLYESFDRGRNWRFFENLPVAQFYRISADNSTPFYWVFGGTQDNNSLGAPSRTLNSDGIMNADWLFTNGGDGFKSQIDPIEPDIVYAQSQYGGLIRYDRRSGERTDIQPVTPRDAAPLRWNWDSPVIISPHSHTRLYFAANIIFRSDDRGNTWRAVSGDLTRQIDRNSLPVMGKVWGPDAVAKNVSTSFYGNIIALTESPAKEGLLYAGTDDGLIQVTEDGGRAWRGVGSFTGVPANTYVSAVVASQHEEGTVYAAFDNHKNADFKPYLLRSTDMGRSWKSIAGNLPGGQPVYCIAEDHVDPDLLFVGTEFGVYATMDGGNNWVRLKSGLPTIPVKDIVIQKRENDLVLATFGRGIYVLDDYSPLRKLTPELLKKDCAMFPMKDALMYIPNTSRKKGDQGETFYTAANPPFGAVITYYIKDVPKSIKEQRKEADKAAREKDETPPYPSVEQLRAEEEEPASILLFMIRDESGTPLRTLTTAMSKGVQRISWDLRCADRSPVRGESPTGSAMLAMPGRYTIVMSKRAGGVVTVLDSASLTAEPLMNAALPAQDRAALVSFQRKVSALQRVVLAARSTVEETRARLAAIKGALLSTPAAAPELFAMRDSMDRQLNALLRKLNGDPFLNERNENQPPSIISRVMDAVWNQWTSTSAPTSTSEESIRIAGEQYLLVKAELSTILTAGLPALEARLNALGAPWTPGRGILDE